MQILCDFYNISDRKNLHTYLQDMLSLPSYYGRNLDALYDLLTEIAETTNIILINVSSLKESLGEYADIFLETLFQASEKNINLTISIQ